MTFSESTNPFGDLIVGGVFLFVTILAKISLTVLATILANASTTSSAPATLATPAPKLAPKLGFFLFLRLFLVLLPINASPRLFTFILFFRFFILTSTFPIPRIKSFRCLVPLKITYHCIHLCTLYTPMS